MRDTALLQVNASQVQGKVAIVTGGNAGIGLETCYFLLKAGYHVIIGTRGEMANLAGWNLFGHFQPLTRKCDK